MFFLAIDGGGTKTTCALADECRILGRAVSGPSNIVRVGEAEARASIHAAVRAACQQAGIAPNQIDSACLGAAGAGIESVRLALCRIVAELVPRSVAVMRDLDIALEAAFADGPGVVVIAGTGSVAYGRDSRGRTARAGGWGWAVSDEGSAHWIGRRAVTAALRAADQGREAATLRAIMDCWRLDTLADLITRANSVPPPNFAQLFPVVLSACRNGDVLARVILAEAAAELGELACLVISRLQLSPARVAICGGVFENAPEVRQAFAEAVSAASPGAQPDQETVDPLEGALLVARRSAGRT
jgi:N-acetylglucosamine kinase-like BadF-type ATPase